MSCPYPHPLSSIGFKSPGKTEGMPIHSALQLQACGIYRGNAEKLHHPLPPDVAHSF